MNHKILKKIAKSDKYQMLYHQAKEIGTISLFSNDNDLSETQLWILYYLALYNSLYKDLASGEEFISEEVIKDDLRTEAYILLRKKLRDKKQKKKTKREVNISENSDSVIFR